ncbi:hypothetical protein K504DRAFT_384104 [Pleomassaria siparia CBS 279.74]|uniref:Uncharacterized protein n=1 Tax=Pleomassaria siparia CBS 279.74 TaxID=1314801 RepID=A0A6G1K3F7_9PLEO|nr:hypothetical protein K504DRAFT_384104 [Pleomassaria siparia CBS 279.74]
MANTLETEGAQTASCVSNLIQSFTNGLDIFKRLRERRRRRKHSKSKDQIDPTVSSAERQLSQSLKRGTTDIQTQYNRNYFKAGDRFAKGDAIAHASLAETLIKLNTGLVSIIATFLNHDTKQHLKLDYKSLTDLSDASRFEAIGSLNQLFQRLSQSHVNLNVYRSSSCGQCGSMKHKDCPGVISRYSPSSKGSVSSDKKRQTSPKSRSSTHMITRVSLKSNSSTQTRLAVVRPRASRKSSSSSSSYSSTKSHSAFDPSYTSPVESPLPQYAQLDPFPAHKSSAHKASATSSRRRANSIDGPGPITWPHTRSDNTLPLPTPHLKSQPPKRSPPPPPREKQDPLCPGPLLKARRLDKPTFSTYTFASGSTKLGEIPQRNWNTPWDYDEAERMNQEAAMRRRTSSVESKPKAKKGMFKFLRRSTGESK